MPSNLYESLPPGDDGQEVPVQDDLTNRVDSSISPGLPAHQRSTDDGRQQDGDQRQEHARSDDATCDDRDGQHGASLAFGLRLAPLPSPGDEIEFDKMTRAGNDSPDDESPQRADAPFGKLDVTAWEQEDWADPELEEFAAQLSVDAQFLAQRFPAGAQRAPSELDLFHSEETTPRQATAQPQTPTQLDGSLSDAAVAARHEPSKVWSETEEQSAAQTTTRRQLALATRSRLTHRLRDFVGILSIAVLLWFVGRPMFDPANFSRDTNVIGQADKPTTAISDAPVVHSRPPGTALAANLGEDDGRVAGKAHAPSNPPQPRPAAAQAPNETPPILIGNGSLEVTPVLYQPEVLFHASQAELEGILDIMRPSQERRIRVAF